MFELSLWVAATATKMEHHYLYSSVDLATQEEVFDLAKGEDTYLVTHPWLKCYGSKQRVLSVLQ